MNTYTDKEQGNKRQSAANNVFQKKRPSDSAFQFVDNRPEGIMQMQMHKLAENSRSDATQRKHEKGVVQRVGVYAPTVTIDRVGPTGIAELESGSGKAINFTGISSCLGVIGKNGDTLVGVHLPLYDKNGVSVATSNAANLGTAVGNLMAGCDSIYIVGEKMVWLSSGARAHYDAVRNAVGGVEFPMGSGQYAAFLDDGDGRDQILLYHNGTQIWPME